MICSAMSGQYKKDKRYYYLVFLPVYGNLGKVEHLGFSSFRGIWVKLSVVLSVSRLCSPGSYGSRDSASYSSSVTTTCGGSAIVSFPPASWWMEAAIGCR